MPRKRVLVTGSSRGIGRAIALRLARDGWTVAVHYGANEAEGRTTVSLLGDAAGGLYQADLASPEEAGPLFERVLADGDVHALVNNAGVYLPGSFADAEDADFWAAYRRTMALNFESPVRLTRAAISHFERLRGGKVLNVASRVGFKGEAGAALYAASKAALINLTRSLAAELAPAHVGFFCLAPGWVDTSMVREGMDERLAGIIATLPLGRMGSPEDCAAAAAFLLTDDAAYLSGITIDINGASYFH